MTCIFKEKGTYFGRVEDPTTAKFAPFVNADPDMESKYGVKNLVFKLWPANGLKKTIYQIQGYY